MYRSITPPTLSRIFDLSGTLEKWCELAGNLGLRLGGSVGSLCTCPATASSTAARGSVLEAAELT